MFLLLLLSASIANLGSFPAFAFLVASMPFFVTCLFSSFVAWPSFCFYLQVLSEQCEAALVIFSCLPHFFLLELFVEFAECLPSFFRNSHPSWTPFSVRILCYRTLPVIVLDLLKWTFLKSSIYMQLHSAFVSLEIMKSSRRVTFPRSSSCCHSFHQVAS